MEGSLPCFKLTAASAITFVQRQRRLHGSNIGWTVLASLDEECDKLACTPGDWRQPDVKR